MSATSTRARMGYRQVPRVVRVLREIGSLPTPMVPTSIVDGHLAKLHAWGITDEAIAQAAGVSARPVTYARTGRYATCRRDIAEAILRVNHLPHPRQALVLALGAQRRLRALACIGWTTEMVATEMGSTKGRLYRTTSNRWMTYENWAAVRDVYDRLHLTPADNKRARNIAAREGWAPPMAWDDIDHPNAQPWTPEQDVAGGLDEVLLARLRSLMVEDTTGIYGRRIRAVPQDVRRIPIPAADKHLYVAALLSTPGWNAEDVRRAMGLSTSRFCDLSAKLAVSA